MYLFLGIGIITAIYGLKIHNLPVIDIMDQLIKKLFQKFIPSETFLENSETLS